MSEYRSLMLHMEWADARVWTSVLSVEQGGPFREWGALEAT